MGVSNKAAMTSSARAVSRDGLTSFVVVSVAVAMSMVVIIVAVA